MRRFFGGDILDHGRPEGSAGLVRSILLATLAALLLPLAALRGQAVRLSSGPARVSLIELFTSEGCSSCPPAEEWMAALKDDPRLWHNFVPVSFHVNYWDNLGWPDRFATLAFTQRQYDIAGSWGTQSVYTPCFVRDGAEWRAGSLDGPGGESPGVLTLEVGESGRARVAFTPGVGATGAGFTAHIALLGGGFSSRVTAGENRGETLSHEFVALAVVDRPLAVTSGGKSFQADFVMPEPAVAGEPRRAIAAWVTRTGQMAPIQAVGGWSAISERAGRR
jgi:hypothetical protein